jgi:hypothetical protein
MAISARREGSPLRLAAAVLVAALACARPAPAPGGESLADGPIRIERCAVDSRTLLADPFNSARTNLVTGVSMRFTNLRDVAATRLTVALRYAGSAESVAARGTFPPGRPVDESVPAFVGAAYVGPSADCRVTTAAFADGTTWGAAR